MFWLQSQQNILKNSMWGVKENKEWSAKEWGILKFYNVAIKTTGESRRISWWGQWWRKWSKLYNQMEVTSEENAQGIMVAKQRSVLSLWPHESMERQGKEMSIWLVFRKKVVSSENRCQTRGGRKGYVRERILYIKGFIHNKVILKGYRDHSCKWGYRMRVGEGIALEVP